MLWYSLEVPRYIFFSCRNKKKYQQKHPDSCSYESWQHSVIANRHYACHYDCIAYMLCVWTPIQQYLSSLGRGCDWLNVLRFNDPSTLVGHFVSSSREREEIEEIIEEIKERDWGDGGLWMQVKKKTEEVKKKHFPLYPHRPCSTVSQYQLDDPDDKGYTTPLPHPNIPGEDVSKCCSAILLLHMYYWTIWAGTQHCLQDCMCAKTRISLHIRAIWLESPQGTLLMA